MGRLHAYRIGVHDDVNTLTHEAGHAVVAYLAGQHRKMEVLSIVKRRDALGLLGHSETEERFTSTRSADRLSTRS